MPGGISGCRSCELREEASATPEERWEALNGQGTVRMNGDFSEADQATDISVDGVSCGYLQESGLLGTKWTVSIQGKDRFYAKFAESEQVPNRQASVVGTTFGFYTPEDTCIGYAQEQLTETGAYHWVFLNSDGSGQGIWAAEDCTELYSDDGTLLARGTADYSYGGDLCTVTIDCVGGQDVPIYAKLVMYEELLTDAKNIHG